MSFDFSALESLQRTAGSTNVLQSVADQLEREKRYHEWFELLKMQCRAKLGLSLFPGDSSADDLPDDVRLQLENGLLEACQRVGTAFAQAGNVREAWMYLRPLGNRALAAQLLAPIPVDDDNIDDLIEILLNEGVDTERGFRLLIERNGICSSITTYDQIVGGRTKRERRGASAALLEKLHAELMANVKTDIQRQEGTMPRERTLAALIADRDWLFQDGAYHIDTTHLAAVVRLSRVLESPDQWRLALDLTHYGRCLSAPLQYQGDEPFAEQYPANALYYSALLGEQVEKALEYFRDKADTLDPQVCGTEAREVYIELLSRVGRHAEALQAAVRLIPANTPSVAYAPLLIDLCEKAGGFDTMLEFCRERGDVLGFTAALALRNEATKGKC